MPIKSFDVLFYVPEPCSFRFKLSGLLGQSSSPAQSALAQRANALHDAPAFAQSQTAPDWRLPLPVVAATDRWSSAAPPNNQTGADFRSQSQPHPQGREAYCSAGNESLQLR